MAKKNVKAKVEDVEKECFVIMPIDRSPKQHPSINFEQIYQELILPIVEGYKKKYYKNKGIYFYKCKLAEPIAPGFILENILDRLANEDNIVIADITDNNPNVFFELGIRFCFRSNGTILICQTTKDKKLPRLPFDVASIKVIPYSPYLTKKDVAEFKREIQQCIDSLEHNPKKDDSPIYLLNVGKLKETIEKLPKLEQENESLKKYIIEKLEKPNL